MDCLKRLVSRITSACYVSVYSALGIAVQEMQHVCQCAMQRNTYQLSVSARRQSFEAWRQLVETLLMGCPPDLLTGELRQNVIFELLQDLLDKARSMLVHFLELCEGM